MTAPLCRRCHTEPRAEGRHLCPRCLRDRARKRSQTTSAAARARRLRDLEDCPLACEACGGAFDDSRWADKPVLDHDHEKNVVRGWLHISCNTALGQLGDSEDRIAGLLEYIRRHNARRAGQVALDLQVDDDAQGCSLCGKDLGTELRTSSVCTTCEKQLKEELAPWPA